MDDRQLLEAAAKAAGIRGEWKDHGGQLWLMNRPGHGDPWNPLTDDGDALRLAAMLCICLIFDEDSIECVDRTVARCTTRAHVIAVEAWSDHGRDRNSATRRAIVRAAAAIGGQHG